MKTVLVDTSIWVDHFHQNNGVLAKQFGVMHNPKRH